MRIAFLLCAERGRLEDQAVLLVRSIRRFAGRHRDAPVYVFQPRRGMEVSPGTRDGLAASSAFLVDEPLNTTCPDYPIANKVFASAWAEENVDADVLAFLDTDSIMTAEPAALELAPGIDAAVRPVDRKRFGSAGEGDEHELFWRSLYRLCDVGGEPRVCTTVDGEPIRAYFNAGLVVARPGACLFGQWRDDLMRLLAANLVPAGGDREFFDQFALAATLGRAFERVAILSWQYNYPLPLRRLLPPPARDAPLETLIHVHYHQWFHRPDYLRLIEPPLDADGAVYRWLEPHLPLTPTISTPPERAT
jgi:hypothetical protein